MSEVETSELPQTGGYNVTLPTFEGPLDLLLHLCQKHELDILDIPIAFVTEKYLEYLAVMQLMSLDVASEYLVMAATLAHIKSKMLLPAPPPGQEDELAAEEEDPREALIRRLLEYQKYKHAGEELASRGVAGRDVFLRGMPIEEAVHTGLPPLAQVPLFSLVEAFQNVLSKSSVKLSHDIVHERVTLADRINELVDILRVRRRIVFEELFEGLETRFDLVITFLALLEMTRLRMTRLFQESFDAPIYIEFTAQVTADDDAEAGTAGSETGADGERTVFDTEAPPPSARAFGDEAGDIDADGDTGTEITSPFDTEAPPPMDVHVPEGAADDAGSTPLHTIPAPPPDDGEEAPEDVANAGDAEDVRADEHAADDDGGGADLQGATTADDALDDPGRSTLLDVPAAGDPTTAEDAIDASSTDTDDASSTSAVFDIANEEAPGDATSTTQDSGARRDDAAPSGDEDT